MSLTLLHSHRIRFFRWPRRLNAGYSTYIVALLLSVTLAYWAFFGLSRRSLVDDEGISILAAQAILQHGYPVLPSGFIYNRGYLPNYLLAGSIQGLGLNDLSIMVPSLLLGLGSLWLVYAFARNAMGKPWVGVAAVTLLILVQAQAVYAASPRMYMGLQFFTLLAAYSTYRGYVQGHRKHQLVALLATGAALLSHQEGAALLVALPLSTLAVLWMRRGSVPSALYLENLCGTLLLGGIAFFTLIYDPPNSLPLIAFHGGQDPEHVGLNIEPGGWVNHLNSLQWVFPYGLAFLPVAVFLAIGSVAQSSSEEDCAPIFVLMVFLLCAMALVTMANTSGGRFWLFILPLLALVVTDVLGRLVPPRVEKKEWPEVKIAGRAAMLLLLVGGAVANLGFVSLAQGTSSYYDMVKAGYGWPCQLVLDARCSEDIKRSYEFLAQRVQAEDLVISSNPWVTHYYLGSVDGLLREKASPEGFSAFHEPTEEYFGAPIIDTLSELSDVLYSDRRTWVIADPKARAYSSLQTHEFLARRYIIYYSDGSSNIYLNCEDPPCGLHGR